MLDAGIDLQNYRYGLKNRKSVNSLFIILQITYCLLDIKSQILSILHRISNTYNPKYR
jgi:hypothetical protein